LRPREHRGWRSGRRGEARSIKWISGSTTPSGTNTMRSAIR
jgi:hypothetical protein